MDPTVDDAHTDAPWLGLAEAAQHEGVALDTMRRRVRRGAYRRRQVRTPRGLTWQIQLGQVTAPPQGGPTVDHSLDPTVGPTVDPRVGAAPAGAMSAVAPLVALVERLQEDVVRKAEAAAMWQTRAEFLASQLNAAQETIRALEAPRGTTAYEGASVAVDQGADVHPVPDPPESPKNGLADAAPQARPWWAFWRGLSDRGL